MANPLDRRESDTARSWLALQDYAAMGAGRSLEKLVERYRNGADSVPARRLTTLKDWSRSGDWQARVAAYDEAQAATLRAEREAVRRQRRIALEEADWKDGDELRRRALELLAEVPKFLRRSETEVQQDGELIRVITLALATGPAELARTLKVASALQRLSTGEPTEIHKAIESELEAFLDKLRDNLTPDEYARVVALAAGLSASGE